MHWKVGKEFGTVVSDTEVTDGPSFANDEKKYGGHLVCRSCTEQNAVLIAEAPEMYEALKYFTSYFELIPAGILGENTLRAYLNAKDILKRIGQ